MLENYRIVQDAYLEHLRYLVSCKTITTDSRRSVPSETQREFARAFAYIKDAAFAVEAQSGRQFYREEFDVDGRLSLILSTHKTKTPDVALLIHMDVVDAPDRLFTLQKDALQPDVVVGRGAYDMKFAAALALVLLEHLPQEEAGLSVSLIFTSDEEKGGIKGAQYICEQGYQPHLLIVPDGGAYDRLSSGSKGAHFFSITTRGTSAHGAYPWFGVNADNMLTAIKARLLQLYPENPDNKEGPTLNIGASVAGGDIPNKVPHLAEALFDFRFTTSKEEFQLRQHLETILSDVVAETLQARSWLLENKESGLPQATSTFLTERTALHINMQHPDIQLFRHLREARLGQTLKIGMDMGTNDSSFWPEVPTILTMPLGGSGHSDTEWVDLQSVHGLAQDILQFLTEKNHAQHSLVALQQSAYVPVL